MHERRQRVSLEMLEQCIGTKLNTDLLNEHGVLLVPKDKVLDHLDLVKLQNHALYMNTPTVVANANANAPVDAFDYIEFTKRATEQLQEIFSSTRQTNKIPLYEIQKNVVPGMFEAIEQPNINALLKALQRQDDYTISHSIGVALIATLLGKWLDLDQSAVTSLSTAATLHDIGKMKISPEILNKPGRLTDGEYKIIQQHTIFGYRLVQETVGTSHEQALVALQHHERMNGTGYPFGVQGSKISLFSRIVGIADVFHAMSSDRAYHQKMPMFEILEKMRQGSFGDFDSAIMLVFLKNMMNAFVGGEVILTNGQRGTVVLIHAGDPTRPLVQTEQGFIDLSRNFSLHIQDVC